MILWAVAVVVMRVLVVVDAERIRVMVGAAAAGVK